MQYREDYEDELDRMRARYQRKKEEKNFVIQDLDQEEELEYGESPEYNDDLDYEEEYDDSEGNNDMNQKRNRKSSQQVRRSGRGTRANSRTASQRQRAPRRRRRHPAFKALLLAVVLLAGFLMFKRGRDDGYWTVAVFGVDSRDGKTGKGALSDVEMVASINKKTGEIRLVSVFRDSYLRMDSEGNYDKINEAYFLGGHEQAVDALRDNLDLKIDDYATFNWKAVVDAINVLGGIDLEITDREFAYINSFITETVNSTGVGSVQLEHSGMNHLDGVQAVAYARLRLMDTDFNRTERQRKVLGLTMEKAKQADFKTLKTLVGAVYPQISTSVGVDDILGVAKNARKYYIGQTSGFPFSHSEMKISKKSCVVPTTLESNVVQLHAFLYDDTSYQPSGMVQEISAHIAKKSGLGEPGKDTESGKNIGAQGNNGGGQSTAPQQTAPPETPAPTEAETSAVEPMPEETERETETESESESAEETIEETIEAKELDDSNVIEAGSGSGDTNETTVSDGNNGSAAGPGGSLEGPGSSQNPSETNASLEGPGQGADNSGSQADSGPGV